jgi:hypothetical protein
MFPVHMIIPGKYLALDKNYYMKKIIGLLSILFTCMCSLHAQDTLAKSNGDKVLVKVLEINPGEIRYKRFSNPDGPQYSISKTDVKYIVYSNGTRESFENSKQVETALPASSSQNQIVVVRTQDPSSQQEARLQVDGNYYRCKGHVLSPTDVIELTAKQKNPQLHLLAIQTQRFQVYQYALGAGGLVLAIAGGIVAVSPHLFNYGNQVSASARHDHNVAGLAMAELALACETASLCFKIERKHRARMLVDAYNDTITASKP